MLSADSESLDSLGRKSRQFGPKVLTVWAESLDSLGRKS